MYKLLIPDMSLNALAFISTPAYLQQLEMKAGLLGEQHGDHANKNLI